MSLKTKKTRDGLVEIILETGEINTLRTRFEEWIKVSPYERDIERWPNDETKYAWYGQYCDIGTQLAWEAWQESAVMTQLSSLANKQ